jgi:UDP-N-acetylglucosamine 2-epimerase (non-hydrolysing)
LKTVLVCGARPNFIKVAPLVKAIAALNASNNFAIIEPFLVHTGQHYDYAMSSVFFKDLSIPQPDVHLGIGSGSHAEQTGSMMMALEKIFISQAAEMVVVIGDVNSTLAGALAAAKLNLPIAHIEAGIRTGDQSMPEEVNRRLTDHVSRFLFTTCELDDHNLLSEGIEQSLIYRSGNILADTLLSNLGRIRRRRITEQLGVTNGEYCLITLHRPSNVDEEAQLRILGSQIALLARHLPVVFPVHPRTRRMLESIAIFNVLLKAGVKLTEPLGYLDFVSLESHSRMVVTDSGGAQVETTILGIPCLTVMDKPVWPITHELGTNHLLGTGVINLAREALHLVHAPRRPVKPQIPLWDGKAAERIVGIMGEYAISRRIQGS